MGCIVLLGYCCCIWINWLVYGGAMSLYEIKGGRVTLFTVAIYNRSSFEVIKPLRTAVSHDKADYWCRYYEASLSLNDNQFIGYDY